MSKRFDLDDELRRNIVGLYGDSGATWLATLDDRVADIETRWNVTCSGVFRSSMSFVTTASRHGTPFAVLKMMPAQSIFFRKELAAHETFAGSIARLLESDAEAGAMLIELVSPGDTLIEAAKVDDVEATRILAGELKGIWRPAESGFDFPTVTDLVADFDEYERKKTSDSALPVDLVAHGRSVFASLARTQGEQVLLHGDLHHANVLRHGEGWKVIDPQGLVGEREYELAAPMRNPFEVAGSSDIVKVARRRARQYAEIIGLDEDRILKWAFAQTVLSLCWQVTDSRQPVSQWLNMADRLAEVCAPAS